MDENVVMLLFVAVPCMSAWGLLLVARGSRDRERRHPWMQVVLVNLLATILLLGLVVLGGEIYYRFIYDTTESMAYTKTSQHWMKKHWHQNSVMVRDDIEYPWLMTPGKRRITFVGDSFTAGHGIKDINKRFVNLVRAAHPEWEVQMLASPGFDTWEETNILEEFMQRHYQIDEVVLVYVLNDVSDLMPERAENLNRINAEESRSCWLKRESYFANTLWHRIEARRDPFIRDYYGFVTKGYSGPIWEKQKSRLKAFQKLVIDHGGRLVVVTFPFLHALGPHYEYQFVHEELESFWRGQGIPSLDLLQVYSNLPPATLTVNRLDPHPNEYAHQLAAKSIINFLTEQMQQKP